MEGFLSTSIDKKKAEGFSKGSIITIVVKEDNLGGSLDNGFADISSHSTFDEKEVLFNPLNIFKIAEVKKADENNPNHEIILEYGGMKNIENKEKSGEELSSLEKRVLINFKRQQEVISKIHHQGYSLYYSHRLKKAEVWFCEYLKMKQEKIKELEACVSSEDLKKEQLNYIDAEFTLIKIRWQLEMKEDSVELCQHLLKKVIEFMGIENEMYCDILFTMYKMLKSEGRK